MNVTLNRQPLGVEDLAFGTGTQTQIRGGVTGTITEINAANLPFDETKSLQEVYDLLLPAKDDLAVVVANLDTIIASPGYAASTEALYDMFDDRYLGSKDTPPTLDNDGDTLLVGALYWDTTLNRVMVWDGANWSDALTLTEASISTLTNKTLDDYTNRIKADAVHMRVKNQSGVIMPKGTVVSYFGYSDTEDAVKVVAANNATGVAIGILAEDLGIDAFGMAIANGIIDGLDTSAYTNGTILYVNTTGGLTSVAPTTGFAQPIAYVLKSNANIGVLQVLAAYPKQDASDVRVTAIGGISSTSVQAALQELDSEKVDKTKVIATAIKSVTFNADGTITIVTP